MSKFLNYGDNVTFADLTNGSLQLYANKVRVANLTPNFPVKTDEKQNLIATKLDVTDINGDIVSNPYNGTLEVKDIETSTFFSINDELNKIDNFEASTPNNTNVTGDLNLTGAVATTQVTDTTKVTRIELDDTDVNVIAQSFTFNGEELKTKDDAFIIVNTDPFNNITSIVKDKGDVFFNTVSQSLFGFQPPFQNEPQERTPISYTGTVYEVKDELEFVSALSEPSPLSIIRLTADITFTSVKTLDVSTSDIKITSDTGTRTITYNSTTSIINIEGDYCLFDGVRFYNNNTSATANCLNFSSTTAANNYVRNCVFTTNESAIVSVNSQIQITNNTFNWIGAIADSNKYITLYKNTGNTIISNNTFYGNASLITIPISITTNGSSSFTNGTFVIKNNLSGSSSVTQNLAFIDATFNINDNVKFWIHDNNLQINNGYVVFYNTLPMTGVLSLVAWNNIETLGFFSTGSRGIISCDSMILTTLPNKNNPPYISTWNNTINPTLQSQFVGWTDDDNVTYNSTVIDTTGNSPKLYSAILQDVIGSSSTVKTANINLPLEANGTRFLNNVYADKFIIYDGPTPAGYLMSDGTILTTSNTNNNSNIYLYNFSSTHTAPPSAGQIRVNAALNLSTILWISHLTRDNIDIDVFFNGITSLSTILIQDQDNSTNYIKYTVNTTPVITPNSYVTLDVTYLEGAPSLSNGHNIIMSIFTNETTIDTRLSNLESATQNQSANSLATFFTKPINMNANKINNVANPLQNTDATTKFYVDNAIADLNISSYTPLTSFNTLDGQVADLDTEVTQNTEDITTLESNTQGLDYISGVSTLTGPVNVLIDPLTDFFAIRTLDQLTNYLILNNLGIQIYKPINMNANLLENISGVKISNNDTNNFFVKTNGTIDSNTYALQSALSSYLTTAAAASTYLTIATAASTYLTTATAASTYLTTTAASTTYATVTNLNTTNNNVTTLQTNTQNLTATNSLNTLNNSLQLNLNINTAQTFQIRDTATNLMYTFSDAAFVLYRQMNLNNQNIINGGNVTAAKFIVSSGLTSQFLKANGDLDDASYIKADGTVSMTQGLNMGTNNIFNAGTFAGSSLSLSSVNAYGIPYFDASKGLQSASKDFFIISNIQTQINSATVGSVIRLCSGSITESIICSGQNYTICGAPCPLYGQTTQVTGNVQIGATTPASTQTRVRIKDIKFIGSLSFVSNSTFQELRTFIDNCDFNGTITFPTTTATISGGTQIYFTNCTFSGTNNPLCVIPNQALYTIYFTRCTFASQPITNSLAVGNFSRLIFSDCGTLPSLSLGNCVLNGLNGSAVTTNISAGSLTIGTTSTTALTNVIADANYTTTFTAGGNTSPTYTITVRRVTNGTNTIAFLYMPAMVFTTGASSTTCINNTALPTNLRPINAGGGSGYVIHPVPIRSNTTYSMGALWIFPNGTIIIAPNLQDGSPLAAPANVSYGMNLQHTISYIVA
jgi:hypothetical protein